jgi:hypothetical protein
MCNFLITVVGSSVGFLTPHVDVCVNEEENNIGFHFRNHTTP